MLNKLITDCINIHTPLRRVKLTRPIAPWMQDPKIIELQKELASQLEAYCNHKNSINHKNYHNTRNKLLKVMKETKANFLRKVLISSLPKFGTLRIEY